MTKDFLYTDTPNIHLQRKREILGKYPQIKELMGPHNKSVYWIIFLVVSQIIIASQVQMLPWWGIALLAYFVGAFFNHALYVFIHEATHNLIVKGNTGNKIIGIFCDLPLILPSAIAFRKYHMIHHKHLNEYPHDPDVVSILEGKIVGNNPLKKALWISFFMLSQALRPLKLENVSLWNRWLVLNLITEALFIYCVYQFLGVAALIYLTLSTVMGLGLHPLGGRWIQEHYVTKEGQETYSYYGPLNYVTFNMGYHNEHHDFMHISWANLPKVKAIAPEYYDNLKSYNSWTMVLLDFIFNPKMDPFKRIVHR